MSLTVTLRPSRGRAATLFAVLLTAGLAAAGCGGGGSASRPNGTAASQITVAAASDLRPAFNELGQLFTARTGVKVTFSFGSSGQLSQQIVNGAPYDLFASASRDYVDEVIRVGRGIASTEADYGLGQIVLLTRSGLEPPRQVGDLVDPKYARVAIANPEHAPYGAAAKEALQAADVYDQVTNRLVFGESISDTFEIVKSGNADVGLIALSLAIADGSKYTLIPTSLYTELRQTLVVTSTGMQADAASAFANLISSAEGRAVMVRFGFALPGETLPDPTTTANG